MSGLSFISLGMLQDKVDKVVYGHFFGCHKSWDVTREVLGSLVTRQILGSHKKNLWLSKHESWDVTRRVLGCHKTNLN